jgi:hypothetical protein
MGLFGDGHDSGIEVDYSKDMQRVLKEAAVTIIQREKNLDILLAACGLARHDGLPSCVPDWRREANSERPSLFGNHKKRYTVYTGLSMDDEVVTVGHGYKASGSTQAVFSFDDGMGTLHVSCKILDTICEVDEVHDNRTSEEIRESAYKLAEANSERISSIPSRKSLKEKVIHVLVPGRTDEED